MSQRIQQIWSWNFACRSRSSSRNCAEDLCDAGTLSALVQSAAIEIVSDRQIAEVTTSRDISLLLAVNSLHVVPLCWNQSNLAKYGNPAKNCARARFVQIYQKWPDAGSGGAGPKSDTFLIRLWKKQLVKDKSRTMKRSNGERCKGH